MERCAWSIEAWGNGGTVERSTVDGKKLLKLIFGGGDKDKTAYKHLTCFGIATNGKLSIERLQRRRQTAADWRWR